MTIPKIPEEFNQFVTLMHPDIEYETGSLESLAEAGVKVSSGNHRQRPVVLAFLNELLDGGYSDAEIALVWNAQSPTYNFSLGGHRVFLEICRRLIIAEKHGKVAK